MIIKMRILEAPEGFYVQTKNLLRWKYKTIVMDISMYEHPARFESEADCISQVYADCKYKRSEIELIRYPNLLIIR